ncbi:MAG TPA: DUF4136 domain-containing protein [Vicinamibacterales bacterium]
MNRIHQLTGIALLAAATTACATMSVSSHVETGLDMKGYRTFDWGPADALPTGDPRLDQDPFFKDQVTGAVEKALASLGMGLVPSNGTPDLLIHYHAHISQRLDVRAADRQFGYCTGDACSGNVFEYEAGTLVFDVVDARTNKVIWRGWAQDRVEPILENRDVMATRIQEAVTRIFKQFPR